MCCYYCSYDWYCDMTDATVATHTHSGSLFLLNNWQTWGADSAEQVVKVIWQRPHRIRGGNRDTCLTPEQDLDPFSTAKWRDRKTDRRPRSSIAIVRISCIRSRLKRKKRKNRQPLRNMPHTERTWVSLKQFYSVSKYYKSQQQQQQQQRLSTAVLCPLWHRDYRLHATFN